MIVVKVFWVFGFGWVVFVGVYVFVYWVLIELGFEIFLELLLVCLVVGFIVLNMGLYRIEFVCIIDILGVLVYVVFFIFVGVGVVFDVVCDSWKIVLVFVFVCFLLFVFGMWFGGIFVGELVY